MRTFGAFSAKGGKPFYGELIGDEVSVLERPFWLSFEPTGEEIGDRDLHKSEKQFGRCKSFDTYTPIGPFVYTNVDVADLEITFRQNGDVKQRARTSQMIYSVADIVSFASQNLTLLPGDVILTGTPSGF